MNLKQLKLSGFKSFVDPTVAHFPSQLVAVLGPNGCGKSNIIDAVRWVMGESSAKNLRGESMTDVIFNGSSNRKPLGQASVELVFDNSLGRLAGPFSTYNEIAVKRVVTRDGDSTYYLNGAKCRRKDITDMFLGTGAGARGYSIIGQGTISQLIEAKPEELRGHLEEAAGVSKYKERRRETLLRMEHTRDNLTRVADIRDELDKQLQRLERQAKAAERYLVLKKEEKQCRSEILALKWRDLTEQQQLKQKEIYDSSLKYEAQQTELTRITSERTVLHENLLQSNDALSDIQAKYYQAATEIARLQEQMSQKEREQKRLEQDKQQLQSDWTYANEQIRHDREGLEQCQFEIQSVQQQVAQLKAERLEAEQLLEELSLQQAQWEAQWQSLQNDLNLVQKDEQVNAVQVQHLEQKRQQTAVRLEKLEAQSHLTTLHDLEQRKQELLNKHAKLVETQQFDEQQLAQSTEVLLSLREELKDVQNQLIQSQDHYLQINSELAALSAEQKALVDTGSTGQEAPFGTTEKRLVDVLQVAPEWQMAVEMVLGNFLNAYVLDTLDELHSNWAHFESYRINALQVVPVSHNDNRPRVADKMKGMQPLIWARFDTILAASSMDEAIRWLPDLADHESILLANGVWLGKGWVKCSQTATQDDMGLLARQQKISELSTQVQEIKLKVEHLCELRDALQVKLDEQQRFQDLFQLNLNGSNEALRVNQNALAALEQEWLHSKKVQESQAAERQDLVLALEEVVQKIQEFSEQLTALRSKKQSLDEHKAQFLQDKQFWQDGLYQRKQRVDELRQQLHRAEIEYERAVQNASQFNQRIAREEERMQRLQERLEQLVLQAEQLNQRTDENPEQLAHYVALHQELEQTLTDRKEQLALIRQHMDDCEKQMVHINHALKTTQDAINQLRMDEQALSVRATSIQEALDEDGLQAQAVLETIPEAITQQIREQELLDLSEKMKRLGAINLAAIEEYTSEKQRKEYLDAQYQDLNQALSALEAAIEKIDEETRERLRATFDEVNASFKSLFPRLFGGGRAELQLTCDNLLEAGIVVMAQPPGKRNSTIHLLSGGEKAMTAVALVFAIFQLNPSPFCMLDEVDAPLDDVNVGRFCNMVKEMSEVVQFLFITHNKVTMEMADHLIGVTMREPGVSRLVAVDVEQALTME